MRFGYYFNPQTVNPEDDGPIIQAMLDHAGIAIQWKLSQVSAMRYSLNWHVYD